MPEFEIQLRDVLIFASHGVMPEERVTGNQYRVNVRLRIDAASFDPDKDDLATTISYADVFVLLRSVMESRAALLETVAVKFARVVCSRWPEIKGGWIEIVKTVPPIPDMIGQAGVRYNF
ncbi:MAG: dihydroneopterin aldolase [Muribaculaceae bacterium]|nr:dihydroneopterin aldolase [Muribaculaceae bacterium]